MKKLSIDRPEMLPAGRLDFLNPFGKGGDMEFLAYFLRGGLTFSTLRHIEAA
jgi:hypothetical protein